MAGALSEEAMLEALPALAPPALAPMDAAADLACAAGLGLLLAVGIAALLGRRTPATAPRPETVIDLLHRLKTTRPDAFARLTRDLYRPGGMPTEHAVREALR